MSDDKPRLPFLLYDTALAVTQKSVNGATHLARSLVGLWPERPLIAFAGHDFQEAPRDGGTADAGVSSQALGTALGPEAALDKRGAEDIGAHVGGATAPPEERRQSGDGGRVPPAEEEGPKPFKPQVGP